MNASSLADNELIGKHLSNTLWQKNVIANRSITLQAKSKKSPLCHRQSPAFIVTQTLFKYFFI